MQPCFDVMGHVRSRSFTSSTRQNTCFLAAASCQVSRCDLGIVSILHYSAAAFQVAEQSGCVPNLLRGMLLFGVAKPLVSAVHLES